MRSMSPCRREGEIQAVCRVIVFALLLGGLAVSGRGSVAREPPPPKLHPTVEPAQLASRQVAPEVVHRTWWPAELAGWRRNWMGSWVYCDIEFWDTHTLQVNLDRTRYRLVDAQERLCASGSRAECRTAWERLHERVSTPFDNKAQRFVALSDLRYESRQRELAHDEPDFSVTDTLPFSEPRPFSPVSTLRLALHGDSLIGGMSRTLAASAAPKGRRREAVVIVHGLGRSTETMQVLRSTLTEAGYTCFGFDYPCTTLRIHDTAAFLSEALDSLSAFDRVHVIGFSLGGLVTRAALPALKHPERIGQMVFVASPHHGTELADLLRHFTLAHLVLGPVLDELVTLPETARGRLDVPRQPFGVIAGSRGTPSGYLELLPGDDDGTVSVASASLAGAADRRALPYSHRYVIHAPETSRHIVHFLAHRRFAP